MNFDAGMLFTGETILQAKLATALIRRSDYGLEQMAGEDAVLKLFGQAGIEGIGGKLHLTNYRLVFDSHSYNRVTGVFSVFLSTIVGTTGDTRFTKKRITVSTHATAYEFIAWGIPALLKLIEDARTSLTEPSLDALKSEVEAHPQKVGSGFEQSGLDLGDIKAVGGKLEALISIAVKPLDIANIANVIELLTPMPK